MEIERINENTVKFYISYLDIEERGFDRDEIWYNRDRSEELFWEMMDEIHYEEEFSIDGPLWIQVQALDKGLEIMVTKAQLSKDGQKLELAIGEQGLKELPVDEKIESLLDKHFHLKAEADEQEGGQYDTDVFEFTMKFNDFEDIIALSKVYTLEGFQSSLYSFENNYYLHVVFDQEIEEDLIDQILSIFLEYGVETGVTIHRIQEYGTEIMSENVLENVRKYFQ
ncbi:MAG: adaptor protein MecA [Bacillus sp. (in: firmicutes)]